MIELNILIYTISILIISSDYFRYAFNFPFFDRIAILISLGVFFVSVCVFQRKITSFFKGYLVLIIFYISLVTIKSIYQGSPISAISYEVFKITTFLFFIPFFSVLHRHEAIKALNSFVNIVLFYYSLNLIFMILQVVINDNIVSLVGIPAEIYQDSQKAGRPMGLFGNLPALALSAVCIYVLVDQFFKDANVNSAKNLKIVLILTVFISTSKIAIIIMVLYYFIKNIDDNLIIKILPVSFFLGVVSFYLINNELFLNKIEQLNNLISLGDSFLLADLSMVDWRFYCYILASKIFFDNPFGLGLGTWGDFSATLNPDTSYDYLKVYMSDSAISHLLAEQGFLLFIYLIIILYPMLVTKSKCFLYWSLIAFLSFITTMGFSDTTWPTIYAFCFALTANLHLKVEKND
ncbi:hypothetical protein D0258_002296 [Vibrio alginolyticus]